MIRRLLKKASILLALPGSIVGALGNRRIVRLRFRFQSPIIAQVFPLPISFIYLKHGRTTLCLHHYKGCGWRGFHHHATLTIAAYGFLIRERADFPPSNPKIRQKPTISGHPRSSPTANPT
jgi:hypothetical protein